MLENLIAFYDVIYECRLHGSMMSSNLTLTLDDKSNILGVYDFGDLLGCTIFPLTVPAEMNVLKYFPEAPLKLVKIDLSETGQFVKKIPTSRIHHMGFNPAFPELPLNAPAQVLRVYCFERFYKKRENRHTRNN